MSSSDDLLNATPTTAPITDLPTTPTSPTTPAPTTVTVTTNTYRFQKGILHLRLDVILSISDSDIASEQLRIQICEFENFLIRHFDIELGSPGVDGATDMPVPSGTLWNDLWGHIDDVNFFENSVQGCGSDREEEEGETTTENCFVGAEEEATSKGDDCKTAEVKDHLRILSCWIDVAECLVLSITGKNKNKKNYLSPSRSYYSCNSDSVSEKEKEKMYRQFVELMTRQRMGEVLRQNVMRMTTIKGMENDVENASTTKEKLKVLSHCLEMPKKERPFEVELCLAARAAVSASEKRDEDSEEGDAEVPSPEEEDAEVGDGVIRLVYGSIPEMWKRRQVKVTWYRKTRKEEKEEEEEKEGEEEKEKEGESEPLIPVKKSFFVLEAHLQSLLDVARFGKNEKGTSAEKREGVLLSFLKERIADCLELGENEKQMKMMVLIPRWPEWVAGDDSLLEVLQDEGEDGRELTLELEVEFVERDSDLNQGVSANSSETVSIPRFLMALDCTVEDEDSQHPSVTGSPLIDATDAFGFEPDDVFELYFDGVRLGEDTSFSKVMEMGYLRLDSDWGNSDVGRRPVVDVVPLPFDENLAVVMVELKVFSASARCCVMVSRDVADQVFLDSVWNKFGLLECPCPFDETLLASREPVTTAFLADFLKPVSHDPLELLLVCENVKLHCVPVGNQKGKREFDLLVSALIETSDLMDLIVKTMSVSPEQVTFVSGSSRVELTNETPLRSLKRSQFEDSMRCEAFRVEVGIPLVETRLCVLDARGINDQKIPVVDGTQVLKFRQEHFLSRCVTFLIHENGEILEDESFLHGGMTLFCVAPPFVIDTQSSFSLSSEAAPEVLRKMIEERFGSDTKSFLFVRPQGAKPFFLDETPPNFLSCASEYIVDVHHPDDPLIVCFRDESQTRKPGICVPSDISTSDLRALWGNAISQPVLVCNGIELTEDCSLLSAVVSTASSVGFRRVIVDGAVARRGASVSFAHAYSRITLKGITDFGQSIVRDLVVQREVTLEEFFRRVHVLIPEIEEHAIQLCSRGSDLTTAQLSELLSRGDGEVVEFSKNGFPENVVLSVHFYPEDSYTSSSILRVFSVPFEISTADLKCEFFKGFGQLCTDDDVAEVEIRFMASELVTDARPLRVVLGHCLQTQPGLDLSGILDFECSPLPETALQQASLESDPLIPVTVTYFGPPKSLSTVVHVVATFRKLSKNEEDEEEEEEGEVRCERLFRRFDVVEAIETELLLWIVSEKFDDVAVKPWNTFLEVVTETGCVRLLTELTLANVLTNSAIQSRDEIQIRVITRTSEPIEEPFAATVPVFVTSSVQCHAEFDVCEMISTADLKYRVAQELDTGPTPEGMRLFRGKTNLTSKFSLADLIDADPFIRKRVGLTAVSDCSIPRNPEKNIDISCSQEYVQGGWGGTTPLYPPPGKTVTTGWIHRSVTESLYLPNGIRYEMFFDGIPLEIDTDFESVRRMTLPRKHMIDVIEYPFTQPLWVLISVRMQVAASRTGRCMLVDPGSTTEQLNAEILSGMTDLDGFRFLEEFSAATLDGTILTDEFTLQDALRMTPPPSRFTPLPLRFVCSRVNLLFPDFQTGISVRPDISTSDLQVLLRDRLWLEYSPRLIVSNRLLSAESTLNDVIRDSPEIEIFGEENEQLQVTVCQECRLFSITASFHVGVDEQTKKTGLFAVDVECSLPDLKSAVCHRFFPKEESSDFQPEDYSREKGIRFYHNDKELSPFVSLKTLPVKDELDPISLVVEEDYFVFIRYCHPPDRLKLGTMSSSSRIQIRDLKLQIAERFGLSITAIHADGVVLSDSQSLGDALRDRSEINIAVCCGSSVELNHRTFVVPQTITSSELIDRVDSPDALHLITQDSEPCAAYEDSELTWKPMPIEIEVHSFALKRIEVQFRNESGFFRTKFLRPDISTADLACLARESSQLQQEATFFVFQGCHRLTEGESLRHFLQLDVSLYDRPLVLDVGFTDKDFADVFVEVRVERTGGLPRTCFVQKTLSFDEFRRRVEELYVDSSCFFLDMKITHYGALLTAPSLVALLDRKNLIEIQLVPREIPVDIDISVRYICETSGVDVYRNFSVPLRISDHDLRKRITKFFPDDLRRDLLVLTFEHIPAARLSESHTLREAVLRSFPSEDDVFTTGELTLYLSRIPEWAFAILIPSESELVGKHAKILWNFESEGPDELSVVEGEVVVVLEEAGEWLLVEKPGRMPSVTGYVPTTYVARQTKPIRVIAKRRRNTASFTFPRHGSLEELQKKIASSPIVVVDSHEELFLVLGSFWKTSAVQSSGPTPCHDPPLIDVLQRKNESPLEIAVYRRDDVLCAVARLGLGKSELPSTRPTTDDETSEEDGEDDVPVPESAPAAPDTMKMMTLEFWFEKHEDIFGRIEWEFNGRVFHDRIRVRVDGVEIRRETPMDEESDVDDSLPTLFDVTSGYSPFRSVKIEIEEIEGERGLFEAVSVLPLLVEMASADGIDSRGLPVPLTIDVDLLRLQVCEEFGISTARGDDMILHVGSREITSEVPLSELIEESKRTVVSIGFVAPISWITVGLSGRVVRVPVCLSTRQLREYLLLGPHMKLFLHDTELTDSRTLAMVLENDPSSQPAAGHLVSFDVRSEKLALKIRVESDSEEDPFSSAYWLRVPFHISYLNLEEAIREVAGLSQDATFAILVNGVDLLEPMGIGELLDSKENPTEFSPDSGDSVNILVSMKPSREGKAEVDDESMNEKELSHLDFASENPLLIRVGFDVDYCSSTLTVDENISHEDLTLRIQELGDVHSEIEMRANGIELSERFLIKDLIASDPSLRDEEGAILIIVVARRNFVASGPSPESPKSDAFPQGVGDDSRPSFDDKNKTRIDDDTSSVQERGAALQQLIDKRQQEIAELTREDTGYQDEILSLESRLLEHRDDIIRELDSMNEKEKEAEEVAVGKGEDEDEDEDESPQISDDES